MSTPAAPGPPTPIAVTGATGRIGGAVAALLHERGAPLRLLLRDPSRTPRWVRDARSVAPADGQDGDGGGRARSAPSVEVAVAQYGDGEAVRAALAGVDVLLMVSASESADRLLQHRTFIDAAAAVGVRHVVYTSFLGAAADAVFTLARTHWATEEHLRASGMGFTLLRDSFYLDFLPDLAVDGVIAGPAGTGRVGAVAREDVARAAAAVLADLGATVVDADVLAREVVAPGTPGLAAVTAAFGDVLRADGSLDRAALGARVFREPGERARLEGIVLPLVAARAQRRLAAVPAGRVAVYDMPLLVEQRAASRFDYVVVVQAPCEVRLARLEGRGLGREEALARLASQASDEQRRAVADVVLDNSGTREELRAAVERLWTDVLVPAATEMAADQGRRA